LTARPKSAGFWNDALDENPEFQGACAGTLAVLDCGDRDVAFKEAHDFEILFAPRLLKSGVALRLTPHFKTFRVCLKITANVPENSARRPPKIN
jgi:hypothetical protein